MRKVDSMGQKVNPNGIRLGINKDWQSRWFIEDKKDFAICLHEDIKIRQFLFKKLRNYAISKIEIERTNKINATIIIFTARPGMILGQDADKNIELLIKDIKKAIRNRNLDLKINLIEIQKPALDAQLIANDIANRLVARASFRNVQKLAIRQAMKMGAKGIKTSVAGRLGGVEMARTEGYNEGTVPLSTFRSDIDYALAEALTTYGLIGVKVWICKGEILPPKKQTNKEAK